MFIRTSSQKDRKTNKTYTTHRLVEGYRTADGKVRQETLLNLGTHFSIPKSQWKLLADRIEELLCEQGSLLSIEPALEKEAQRIAKLIAHKYSAIQARQEKAPASTDYHSLDVASLQHQEVRHVGAEHVGYHAALQLQLDDIIRSVGLNQKKTHLALASIIGRLVHPGSELNTHRYLKDQSSLDELIGTDFSNLSLKNFYNVADELLKHKDNIESALYCREKDLFHLDEVVTLYDITNTYFEGRACSNNKAHYGRSKEKRSDCPLVSLGLVLDGSGFPKKSDVFPGNISEPGTLESMLQSLGAVTSATVVMDAGFASEENIRWLKDKRYTYIVVSRKRSLHVPEDAQAVLVKDNPNNTVSATLVKNDDAGELELYCHSQAKQAKTIAMRSKSEARFEDALQKLVNGLSKKRGTKKYDKINERVGRLKERYKRVANRYSIEIVPDDDKQQVLNITWRKIKSSDSSAGLYCLRTNRMDLDEKAVWNIYTMLTEVEAAFRSLKTELGFRPVFHQKEARVDAHLFISVLAYHLLHTIRYQLKANHIFTGWQSIRDLLSTQMRITTTMMREDGKKLSIRKTTLPTPEQLSIYKALGVNSTPGETERSIF